MKTTERELRENSYPRVIVIVFFFQSFNWSRGASREGNINGVSLSEKQYKKSVSSDLEGL